MVEDESPAARSSAEWRWALREPGDSPPAWRSSPTIRQARPPQLYEFFLDNFWFAAADLEHQALNPPLKGKHSADIVIIGGGYAGLASAFHLSRTFPNKKIVLLEGACCGYGASGRNGGFCDAGFSGLLPYVEAAGADAGRKAFDASLFGISQIKRLGGEHGVQCDFEENGMLETATSEEEVKALEKHRATYASMGIDTTLVQGRELQAEVRSPRYLAALEFPYGAILNPAKLPHAVDAEAGGRQARCAFRPRRGATAAGRGKEAGRGAEARRRATAGGRAKARRGEGEGGVGAADRRTLAARARSLLGAGWRKRLAAVWLQIALAPHGSLNAGRARRQAALSSSSGTERRDGSPRL